MAPLITLTTDFGTRDPYVAAMKGVIARICPDAAVLDLTHAIAPQDVVEAALFVAGAAPWFPPGSVHVVVVDPGVGTARRPIAAAAGGMRFVCPDNGLLSLFLDAHPLEAARAITNPACMLADVSATFHGRDVFAPCAARLAAGLDLAAVGEAVPDPVRLALPAPVERDGALHGEVVHVDRFGNCISNVHARLLGGRTARAMDIAGVALPLRRTYGEASPGEALALLGSGGFFEAAVNGGSASAKFDIGRGARVKIRVS
jgi:hypothetical protein